MLKIAIIGPESTGKTELCRRLAEYFNCTWVPELAREYVERRNFEYTFDDVEAIARLQIEQEEQIATDAPITFFDTDLIITKVWLEHKYKKVPDFVVERLASRYIDFYLLCVPDLPWELDPVRENGSNRDYFFDWYAREVKDLGTPYAYVSGYDEARVQCAIEAIHQYMSIAYENNSKILTKLI